MGDLYSHDTLAMEYWHEAIEIMNVGWHVDKEGKLEEVIHPKICDLIIGSSTITIPSLARLFFFFLFWFFLVSHVKKIQKLQRKVSNFESQFLDVWKSQKYKTSLLFITKWISLYGCHGFMHFI
jgi:hypothetical protein